MTLIVWNSRFYATLALAVCAAVLPSATHAQVVIAPDPPVIGSSNTVTADPPVSHPKTTPCAVTLFTNLEFADYNTKNYTYTPPKGCEGPWAKVIFKADFTVTAGLQFDRSAQFYLGGANIFFGTTPEPRAALSPSWHVERDVTDLSALLHNSQAGTAILGNFIGESGGSDYTGIIYGDAQLEFYPPERGESVPAVPDVVIGLPGNGGAATLNTTASQLTQAVTLPRNVEKAYLDVIAQSQSNDEFWYLCVPDALAAELQSCGGTGFRETEISIDGVPAGVAPVYPWIFTGGIDPALWEPIPGVQTLNFKPFRVDLTPFAGVLSNGKPHTVAISVFNADSYFAATATLLVYTDRDSRQVTGEVISNTLAATPTPTITNKILTDASGNITGYVTVASKRNFSIVGKTLTSHGTVITTVAGNLNFSNSQNFVINDSAYKQDLTQSTEGLVTTTTVADGAKTVVASTIYYPFTFNYDETVNADGTLTVHNASNQQDWFIGATPWDDHGRHATPFLNATMNEVISQDDMHYDANGNFTGRSANSTQNYVTGNSTGYCSSRALTSKNLALTSDKTGAVCSYLYSKF
ncbi:peptide-N4-asparagine amidase [Acidicapsa ligni]|uniref:peptide-N4-asparagine amidase n=1 Tax=Acidicapsa ligni TaxID=542300 RepID=UPI0021E0F93A|nr:peptide-N4-asparagine amidase [Acidicapsa ligni]